MTQNIYSWRINHLIITDLPDHERVVSAVDYTVRAEREGKLAEIPGSTLIPQGDLSSFTAFNQLTEQQVMSWVMGTFNVNALRDLLADLDLRLETVINPPLRRAGDLPWAENPSGAEDVPLVNLLPDITLVGDDAGREDPAPDGGMVSPGY
jgi:hypothetical protein